MAEFWQRRDPTAGTVRNEFLEVYLARLDYIEENFSVMNTLGINTDPGRVYALLGEPDIIEYRPLEEYSLPTQTWTYFTPPTVVSFADFGGFGEFELITDWEEVQNAYERH
jgi:GWxTD domain-containing protein